MEKLRPARLKEGAGKEPSLFYVSLVFPMPFLYPLLPYSMPIVNPGDIEKVQNRVTKQ